nr:transglutaminase domain-containing protein [uncultured Allomuricauda sp.]
MTKKVIVVLLLTMGYTLSAQDYKFRKVSKEELKEKVYAKDSTAPAAYLYINRKSFYRYSKGEGLFLITEIHKRIKIYNTDGFDYATETINLYEGDSEEKATAIKGYTYTLEGDDIVETKLGKDGIFKTQQSKNRNQVKFTMPNVKAGSVVEFSYTIRSPYVQSIDEFIFQDAIPIKKVVASMRILEYFKFRQRQKGFLPLVPKVDSTRDPNLNLNVTTTSYDLEHIPAMKRENFVSNIRNYRAGVKFEIISLEIPGSTYKAYSKTWDDVVKTIYTSGSFGDELDKSNYFKEELDVALEGVAGEEARIKKVLEFAKQKVKWNTYRGYGVDEGTRKAYKEGTGNSADINLMLVAMLKHAGIKAHPVLTSTRDHGVPLFPTLQGYNYVIAAAKVGDTYHLLDATNSYSTMDVLPTRTLNWLGRMVSENGNSETMDLMPRKKSIDMVMMQVDLNEDGSIDAKIRQQYTQNNAYMFRNMYNKGTEESFLEELEKEQGDIEISDYELKNNEELYKPIVQNYSLYKEDVIETISGKLYFSPMLHLCTMESPFKAEKREYPVDYGFPWEDKYMITIKIPEGYKVESVPESIALSLPDNVGSFKYLISATDTTINLRATLSSPTAVIPANYYEFLKQFYTQIVEKETEKVVLSKI